MFAKRADRRRQIVIVGHERAGVAHGTEILRRVEAEGTGQPGGPGPKPIPFRAMRLAGILDDTQPMAGGERIQRLHICHLAVEVHRQEERRPTGQARLDRRGIKSVVGLPDVHQGGRGAGLGHRLQRRDEGLRRHDHLVARPDSGSDQRQRMSRAPWNFGGGPGVTFRQ